jgi:cholesterol oxidase
MRAEGGPGRGFYVEDAGFPQHLAWMLQAVNLPGSLWWLAKRRFIWDWFGESADPNLSVELSDLFGNTGLSAGVLPLLGMGRDLPYGRMTLRSGRLDIDWKHRKSGAHFGRVREASRQISDALGARFAHDPLRSLGRVVTDLNRLIPSTLWAAARWAATRAKAWSTRTGRSSATRASTSPTVP